MNFITSIFRKPAPQPLRYVAATRHESLAAQRRRTEITLLLAVATAQLTPEDKQAAIARASIRSIPVRG